jgi:nucleoid-associated protein YgaU
MSRNWLIATAVGLVVVVGFVARLLFAGSSSSPDVAVDTTGVSSTASPVPSPSASLAARPLLVVNPRSVSQGASLSLWGSGFQGGATIAIYLKQYASDNVNAVSVVEANPEGRFGELSLSVPESVSSGSLIIEARDRSGGSSATAGATVIDDAEQSQADATLTTSSETMPSAASAENPTATRTATAQPRATASAQATERATQQRKATNQPRPTQTPTPQPWSTSQPNTSGQARVTQQPNATPQASSQSQPAPQSQPTQQAQPTQQPTPQPRPTAQPTPQPRPTEPRPVEQPKPAEPSKPNEPPKPSEPPEPTTSGDGNGYTVEAGDSLSAIAAKVYGNANAWQDLYDANSDAIGSNPNLIHPGTELVIPPKD